MKLLFGASLVCLVASATMLLAALDWLPSDSGPFNRPVADVLEPRGTGSVSDRESSEEAPLTPQPDAGNSATIFAEPNFRKAIGNVGRNEKSDPEYVTVYGVECHRSRSLYAWESPVQFTKLCKSVEAAFGDRRDGYLYEDGLVGKQILQAQGIPDLASPAVRLGDGNFLLLGCRHHSCHEKSALVSTPDGEMLAAGLINFHCRAGTCSDMPILTIFVRPEQDFPVRIEQLKVWAKHVNSSRRPITGIEKIVLR